MTRSACERRGSARRDAFERTEPDASRQQQDADHFVEQRFPFAGNCPFDPRGDGFEGLDGTYPSELPRSGPHLLLRGQPPSFRSLDRAHLDVTAATVNELRRQPAL